jgi:type IV pilus assembly protein PilC
MPSFEWKRRARGGQDQTGVLVADNKEAAISVLRRQQIVVTAVKEKGKEIALPKMGGRVAPQLVAIFTRQFSVMIDAGLPLVQCLEILGSQQENKAFRRALLQIRQDVESGSNLADSMRKHPKIFNDLYTNMVAAGEAGGILDTILQRLAAYIEKSVKLNAQVKAAMIYPVAVISIAVIVVAVILWKVIPVFASLFKGLGADLPLPTVIVINLSNFIGDFWWLILIVRTIKWLLALTVMIGIGFGLVRYSGEAQPGNSATIGAAHGAAGGGTTGVQDASRGGTATTETTGAGTGDAAKDSAEPSKFRGWLKEWQERISLES